MSCFADKFVLYLVESMNGNELIKKIRKLGKERDLTVRIDKKRGRGSHFTLYFGNKRTIMKDRTQEIGAWFIEEDTRQSGSEKR